MMDELICRKRDELNQSIVNGDDYDKIYNLSVELDELIAEYYRTFEKGKQPEYEVKKK